MRKCCENHDLRIKILFFVFIAFVTEVVVCNFRTWESIGWKAYNIIEEDMFSLKDGQYEDNAGEGTSIIAPFREDSWCDLTIFDGEINVKNVYLLCRYLNSEYQPIENSYVTVYMKARDEGNELSYQLPDRVIVPEIERTHYNRLNLCGKLKGLELTFLKPTYTDIAAVEILACRFNVPVPFRFSFIRFAILMCLFLFVYSLYPKSKVYNIHFGEKFSRKKESIVLCMILCITFSLVFANINPQYYYRNYKTMYHELAEALLDGHVYLNEEPAGALEKMENPYDTRLRDKVISEAGETWRLDRAYYKGKYYVYFGVVPVLLLFMPYYALTGMHLSITAAVSIFGCFYVIGCFALLYQIFKRYFSNTPFVIFLLSCVMLIFCSGMFYAFRGPAFYGLPILAAAAFAVWGLWFWYGAEDEKGHKLKWSKVMCGSLCIALTAGCRPQFLTIAFASLFIFKDYIFNKKYLLSKEGVRFLNAWMCPALLVAIGVMYYNFIRFGSPLDFGANYNLTSNDMTHRGWHWDRTLLGVYMYLFDPTKINAVFPFILDSIMPIDRAIPYTNYMGVTIVEGNFGGIIFNHPILILPFAAVQLKKYCKNVYKMILFFTISALLIVVVDTQMSGLVGRYLMDFGWLLCLSTILLYASIEENCNDNTLMLFVRGGILVSVIWGIIYEFLLAFNIHTNSNLQAFAPQLYYRVLSITEFWL